jgi:uncharacterized protein YbjT (DUF2867 family)
MKKILILGGTGFVGRHVCEKLVRLGWQVTVPSRKPHSAKALQMLPRLDLVQADVHDASALMQLLPGHHAVVNLVAILHGNAAAFERTHVTLARTLAQACAQTGVRRVVHVSALGAASDAPSMYQRSKAAGEAALQAGGLNLTVLRPSVIFGAEDKFLNLFAQLQRVFPVMPLAGGSTRFQPVWVEDVADAVVQCLKNDSGLSPIYELGGPDVFTLKQLVQLAGTRSGCPRPVLNLPMALGRLQAMLMALAPGEPLMSRDNLDSMAVDNVASGKLPGLSELGITAAPLSGIAGDYLGPDAGGQGPRSGLQGLRKNAGRF